MATSLVFGIHKGSLLIGGLLYDVTTTHTPVQDREPAHKWEAEQWSGEHEEHHPAEEQHRKESIVHEESAHHDEDTPIASSAQFERKRTDSLTAALLHTDPLGVPTTTFVQSVGGTLFEAEEGGEEDRAAKEEKEEDGEDGILARLILTLRECKMASPDKHAVAIERLHQLEEELRLAGAICPPDPAVADAVARALAAAAPGRDIQIRVNQSRHTATTKTVYETETPGMAGLDPDHIRALQQEMINALTSGAGDSTNESGTTQKKETAEEGFTTEDGSVVVSKKMTRVVTTTRTTAPGEDDAPGE